jgi:hypothetical protein
MRMDKAFVRYWSGCYEREELGSLECELLATTHAAIAERGCLTADELTKIVRWKSSRALGLLERDSSTIKDVTRVAFTPETPDWMRHHILCILDGVGHPVASAILTVRYPDTHTVIDKRAVAALRELWRREALDAKPHKAQEAKNLRNLGLHAESG